MFPLCCELFGKITNPKSLAASVVIRMDFATVATTIYSQNIQALVASQVNNQARDRTLV